MSKQRLKALEETEIYQFHYNYMQSVIPTLIDAEKVVHSIKGSEQWNKSLNYFNVLYKRGQLAHRPTMENGYKIEPVKPLRLHDIEDILTPEQIEIIKNRLKED